MMNKTVILLFFLVSFSAFCRNKGEEIYPLDKYEVVNPNIFPVLDSIIAMKDNIRYYKSTGLFTIEFNMDKILTDLILIRAQGNQMYYRYPDRLGYFNYKEHTFVIRGDSIDTSIFKKTSKYRNFTFGQPPVRYTKKGKPILNRFNSFAVWSIRYNDGKFKILSFSTDNKKDNWFNYIYEEYKDKDYPLDIED